MPELTFHVLGAEGVRVSDPPAVGLQLTISNRPAGELIQSVVLRCQVQIEAPRRRYSDAEKARLDDLFGEPERWGQTLRSMLWANVATTVPEFAGATNILLEVPCSFDPDVATMKYFSALDGGTVPITLLFSGTVFYKSASGKTQIAPISWNSEARLPFPVDVWKHMLGSNRGAVGVGN